MAGFLWLDRETAKARVPRHIAEPTSLSSKAQLVERIGLGFVLAELTLLAGGAWTGLVGGEAFGLAVAAFGVGVAVLGVDIIVRPWARRLPSPEGLASFLLCLWARVSPSGPPMPEPAGRSRKEARRRRR